MDGSVRWVQQHKTSLLSLHRGPGCPEQKAGFTLRGHIQQLVEAPRGETSLLHPHEHPAREGRGCRPERCPSCHHPGAVPCPGLAGDSPPPTAAAWGQLTPPGYLLPSRYGSGCQSPSYHQPEPGEGLGRRAAPTGLELQTRCTQQPAGLYRHPKRTPLENSKDRKPLSKPEPRGPQGAERTHPAAGQEGGCQGSPTPAGLGPSPGPSWHLWAVTGVRAVPSAPARGPAPATLCPARARAAASWGAPGCGWGARHGSGRGQLSGDLPHGSQPVPWARGRSPCPPLPAPEPAPGRLSPAQQHFPKSNNEQGALADFPYAAVPY